MSLARWTGILYYMFEDIDDTAYAGSTHTGEQPFIRVGLSPLFGQEPASVQESTAAIGTVPFGKSAHEFTGLCIRNARSLPVVAFPAAVPCADNHDPSGNGTTDSCIRPIPPPNPEAILRAVSRVIPTSSLKTNNTDWAQLYPSEKIETAWSPLVIVYTPFR